MINGEIMGKAIAYPVLTLLKIAGVKFGLISISLLALIAITSLVFFNLEQQESLRLCIGLGLIGLLVSTYFCLQHEIQLFKQQIELASGSSNDYRDLKSDTLLFGSLAQSFYSLLRGAYRRHAYLNEQVAEIRYSSEQVTQSALAVSANVNKQSESTRHSAVAITQMSHSMQEVVEKIVKVNDSAEQARTLAKNGRAQLSELSSDITQVKQQASDTLAAIQELNKNSEQVLSLTAAIEKIAEQTNLLALNASIEAARAGDMGRGFAVVADEVRTLASVSKDTAANIINSIEAVRTRSNNVQNNMQAVAKLSESCVNKAEHAQSVMQDIYHESDKVQQQIMIVSANTEQQSIATKEISVRLDEVVQIAKSNAGIAEQTTELAGHLKNVTQSQQAA